MSLKTTADDRVWRKLREKVRGIGEAKVKVGVLGGTSSSCVSLPELAAIHEFGAPKAGIPSRSFIRFTIKNRSADLTAFCERLARGLLADKLDVGTALGMLGAWTAAAMKKSITARLIKQDLAQATLLRRTKGSGKRGSAALLDSGQLKNSISWAIAKVSK